MIATAVRWMALGALASVGAMAPASAEAQDVDVHPGCIDRGILGDACQKVSDMFTFLTPQLGAVLAGGNAVAGQAGAIGTLGHLSVGVRVTGMRATLPEARALAAMSGEPQRTEITVTDQWVGVPTLDAAIGLFGGMHTGSTRVGAVDVLFTGSWLPAVALDQLSLRSSGSSFKAGFGARVGVLGETTTLPAVDVTFMRRQLPVTDLRMRTLGGDSLSATAVGMRADSWRVVMGKSFLPFAVTVGAGQDDYRATALVSATLLLASGGGEATLDPLPLDMRLRRTNAFANVALNAGAFRLVGEVGRAWGGTVDTFNSFAGSRAGSPRTYGSVGILLGS